jgi:hypothetical protein
MAAVENALPRELELAARATSLAMWLIDFLRNSPLEEEANSLASWMGLRRAVEQLRVALMAALMATTARYHCSLARPTSQLA